MAWAARAGSAAPDSTAQAWAMASMRHSPLSCEPSQVPSSKVARRYQAPSHATASMAVRTDSACARQSAARASPRPSASGAKRATVRISSQPSHTLSPCPSAPTRFMPSFQSPVPMSGSPCRPVSSMHWSNARAQCSNSEADSPDGMGWKNASCSPGCSAGPSRKGTASSSTARSPEVAMYSAAA